MKMKKMLFVFTVLLGLSALLKEYPELAGCMFALGDQPLLTKETLEAMVITFSQYYQTASPIFRLAAIAEDDSIIPGNPILFGNRYFEELLTLPDNHGGNIPTLSGISPQVILWNSLTRTPRQNWSN